MRLIGHYLIVENLGRGEFGKIQIAKHTEVDEVVVIKTLEKKKLKVHNITSRLKKDITIVRMISHPSIVAIIDVFATATKVFVVQEYVQGSMILEMLHEKGKFAEDLARKYFKQIVEAMVFCHGVGVCHRNLSIDQLLFSSIGRMKILNFGLGVTCTGKYNYFAPEISNLKAIVDDMKVDVWSMGVILYIFITGNFPQKDGLNIPEELLKVAVHSFSFSQSNDCALLLSAMLQLDPSVRHTMLDVNNHPWFVTDDDNDDDNDDDVRIEDETVTVKLSSSPVQSEQMKTPSNRSGNFSCISCWEEY